MESTYLNWWLDVSTHQSGKCLWYLNADWVHCMVGVHTCIDDSMTLTARIASCTRTLSLHISLAYTCGISMQTGFTEFWGTYLHWWLHDSDYYNSVLYKDLVPAHPSGMCLRYLQADWVHCMVGGTYLHWWLHDTDCYNSITYKDLIPAHQSGMCLWHIKADWQFGGYIPALMTPWHWLLQ